MASPQAVQFVTREFNFLFCFLTQYFMTAVSLASVGTLNFMEVCLFLSS